MERLEHIKINPKVILDLGCGTGYFIKNLQHKFPQAQIIALDFADGMLKIASKLTNCICANAKQLPIANKTIDLVFANCVIPHIKEINDVLAQIHNILNQNGVFLFTSYGPDTLLELGMKNHWPDMHQIGDLLLKMGFKDPVVDNEVLSFKYKKIEHLLDDLTQTGAYIIDKNAVDNLEHPITATYEIVYGHAWGKEEQPQAQHSSNTFYVEVTR